MELLKYRGKQNAMSELFGLLLESQGIVKNSDIKKINNVEFQKETVLKLAKAPVCSFNLKFLLFLCFSISSFSRLFMRIWSNFSLNWWFLGW
jgi:hypothetical protein